MSYLVVYSSITGNTRRVAEAVYGMLPEPKDIYPVEEAPEPGGYDFIALGFWIDKGTADEKIRHYIKGIRKKNVGLFGTSGAYPDSDHVRSAVKNVENLLGENRILGSVMCQGKIDDAFAEKLDDIAPESRDVSPDYRNRAEEARSHPDPADLKNVQTAFTAMLKKLDV
jgi:flavodoxin